MTDKRLHVTCKHSRTDMFAQLQCNYADWLAEGYPEEDVFTTLQSRVTPLMNGYYRGWQTKREAQRNLGWAWSSFLAWRAAQVGLPSAPAAPESDARSPGPVPPDGAEAAPGELAPPTESALDAFNELFSAGDGAGPEAAEPGGARGERG